MKTLLIAINASYSHTCLAVRGIAAYCNSPDVSFVEFTINQPYGDILRVIVENRADLVLFSTYIWNAELTCKLIPDVKNLLPNCKIGAGGPEFGYAAEKYMNLLPELDFVIKGEGEKVIRNVQFAMRNTKNFLLAEKTTDELTCKQGPCIYFRDNNCTLRITHCAFTDSLAELAFPYPELVSGIYEEGFTQNRIFYYESLRGCPYSCAYCLSSADSHVRFMPLERVFSDLQIFLDAGVKLVKFVDRTYNLKPERYIAIWKYIVEHHNKKTMFHFEIEAEYLSEDALEFLQSVPAGVMQFEIGVQSANKKTLQAVGRSSNVEKLAENIKRIPRTIHQHLDLIAGLPYENLESFGHSFDFVMDLSPDALQLGFLKILHGTPMEKFAEENGWVWSQSPVYETFSTPYMGYEDMQFLKDIETLVDAYWNSGVFVHSMKYIGRIVGFWKFFCSLVKFSRERNVFTVARRETYWFELLAEYAALQNSSNSCFLALIKYDFVLRGKQGNWPSWYTHIYDKNRHRELFEMNGGIKNARLDFAHSEYEVFEYNVDAEYPENNLKRYEKLIKY